MIKANVNVLNVYINQTSGDVQISRDDKWVTDLVSKPDLRETLVNTLRDAAVLEGESHQGILPDSL